MESVSGLTGLTGAFVLILGPQRCAGVDLGTASSLEKLEVPLVSRGRKKCFPPESLKEWDKTELAGEALSCYKGGRTSHVHPSGLLQDTKRWYKKFYSSFTTYSASRISRGRKVLSIIVDILLQKTFIQHSKLISLVSIPELFQDQALPPVPAAHQHPKSLCGPW